MTAADVIPWIITNQLAILRVLVGYKIFCMKMHASIS